MTLGRRAAKPRTEGPVIGRLPPTPTPFAPLTWGNEAEHRRQIAQVANRAVDGKLDSVQGPFSLSPDPATSTTVADARCGVESIVLLMPVTANAASAMPTVWIAPGVGQFTVNHAPSAITDRTYLYVVIG
jgi:hypothetical protein